MFKPKTKQPARGEAKCQNCKADFTIEPEDFEFYKKMDVPEPTFCPECRLQRRMIWRNERSLYKRKCDFSGKEVFSAFSSEAPIKIYDRDIWWSDKWDDTKYGQDYDFNRPFFEQIKKLTAKVPWASRPVSKMVNSDYCMNASYLKNCYLVFGASYGENCVHCVDLENCKDCYDSYDLIKCELCYYGFMLNRCYKTLFSSHCDDCQEIYFCHDCVGCSNCFGCTNLRHKKYHIFNKPYSKQEYFKKIEEFDLGSYQNIYNLKQKIRKRHLQFPVKFMHGRKNNNVTGEYIYNSKNVFDSYMVKQCEDSRYCHSAFGVENYDFYDSFLVGSNSKIVYESVSSGLGINRLKFCFECWPDCRNLEYCLSCHSCSDCFGCVGLRKKQYYIFNKQYTKAEYGELISKIKKQMDEMPYIDKKGRIYKYGEFFPSELSPYAYNEVVIQDFFPLTKEPAIKQGYNWYDKPKSEYKPTIKVNDLPDHIKDINKSILKEVIACSSDQCIGSGVYRIVPQELQFYQKINLPLPRLCPDCRHQERIKQRNPFKLYHRQCMKQGCSNEFETSYAPDKKEIVYCEDCYNKEVS